MYVVCLAGGIASGKSTVASMLEGLGALRCDLDQVSRAVLEPPSSCLDAIAAAFGQDLIDPATGALDRAGLARRAFATRERTRELEAIELPAIAARLRETLATAADQPCPPTLVVVEAPLLDRALAMGVSFDEVAFVDTPRDLRLRRAIERGMSGSDFDARDANQPSAEFIRTHATTIFSNTANKSDLERQVRAWYERFATTTTPSSSAAHD